MNIFIIGNRGGFLRAEKNKVSSSNIFIMLLICLFYFIIAMLTPYTCDDWVWGSEVGIERLKNGFDNYNGRYLGNILEIIFTRQIFIKSVIMSFINTGIVFFSTKIIWKNARPINFGLIWLLIMFLPLPIFSQTYGWAAGFANYNTAAFFTLFALYIFRDFFNSEWDIRSNQPIFKLISIVFLGITSQLFVEHVTIFNFMLAVFLLIKSVINKRGVSRSVSYFIGTLVGAVVMFTNQSYITIIQGEDSYRTIDDTGLVERLFSIFTNYMSGQLIQNNILINMCISILLVILIKKGSKFKKMSRIFSLFLLAYPLYFLISRTVLSVNFVSNSTLFNLFNPIFSFVYILVIGFSFLLMVDKEKASLIFYICSFALVSAPLFFVTPLSPRCFLSSYIFLVLITGTLFKDVNNIKTTIKLKPIILFGIFSFISVFTIVFTMINRNYSFRTEYIQEQVSKNEKVIKLWRIPNDHFLWESTPNPNGYMEQNFRKYYGIPEDVKFDWISVYEIVE